MDERLREILGDEDAWVVGGAVRDELLLRPVLDLDVACAEPRDAANRFARRFGGSVFPLSERHGAWRVVADGIDETVDFTPLGEGIDADLATRDFTFNAIAVSVRTGETHDPHDGRADLAAGVIRAVSETISSTTRSGCCARCASKTSSDSAWTSAPRPCSARRPRS